MGSLVAGLRAGLAGAVAGGVPSTLHALATGGDVRQPTLAAGSILLRDEHRAGRLLAAGAVVHLGVSVAWGVVLGATLPERHPVLAGSGAGLLVAVIDLGLIGRRLDRIAALPLAPQVADHIAYGATVGVAVGRRRQPHGARATSGS